MREKGEGFAGTIIKDTWTITRGDGNRGGRGGRETTRRESVVKEHI